MGRFPVRSRIGNYFIVLANHIDSNVILVNPFQSRHNHHRLAASNRIMSCLQNNGHSVDLHMLDNECSTTYKLQIEEKWKATFQLVYPDMHRRNSAKLMIQTFKAHFLSILYVLSSTFPNFLWDKLFPQTDLTLSLLHQSNIAPAISA